ncbi:MAG: hypothetical protein R3E95_11720 [Thiolinea sp.]
MKPGVVHCFHGWNQANINELTDDQALDLISGFPPFKAVVRGGEGEGMTLDSTHDYGLSVAMTVW